MSNINKPDKSEFRDKTLELLKRRSRLITFDMISENTGVSKRWLDNFQNGLIPNPGVCYVEAVYKYLTTEPLLV